MNKLLFSVFGFIVLFSMGILVMIHGWGLEPQSWGWIIGGGLTGIVFGAFFQLGNDN